jgi:hypothetical protein
MYGTTMSGTARRGRANSTVVRTTAPAATMPRSIAARDGLT